MSGVLWITGVSGFAGRHLAAVVAAIEEPPHVVGIGRQAVSVPHVNACETADLRDPRIVEVLARRDRPDWVIHLAGRAYGHSSAELWEANAGTLLALGQGLAAAGSLNTRVVSIGSAAEYRLDTAMPLTENSPALPASDYGRAKLAQTLIAEGFRRTFGISACVARTFNLFGPRTPEHLVAGRLVGEFARAAADGEITVRALHTQRDFVDVRDAARAWWALARGGSDGEIYNVCSGEGVAVTTLIEHFRALSGKQPRIRVADPPPAGADPALVVGSNRKLVEAVGWHPVLPLRQSLADMWQAAAGDVRGRAAVAAAANGD